jgi:protein-S-isoprenylcysteine O-methyltransferase Ste14
MPYWTIFWGFVAYAAIAFVWLQFTSAPYGRHLRDGWGPRIDATLGWVVMEAPSPLVFLACWWLADPVRKFSDTGLVFLLLWESHYVYRAFVFPFRRRGGQREMPASIALMAIVFNLANAWLNAQWLYVLGPWLSNDWFADPRFLVGLALFVAGWMINHESDAILFRLRASASDGGYRIPFGGLFRFVSCPNYLGELIEWSGWALCTFSPAGLAFALASAANLLPRARSHHRWYRETFPDYPKDRSAILPWLY